MSEARLRIELLGGLRAEGSGRSSHFRTRKAASLLAYLAFHPGSQPRESLVEVLWPEAEPDAGRNCLRVTLSVLRSGLGSLGYPAVLVANRQFVALDRQQCDIDLREFYAALDEAAKVSTAARLPALARAVGLYRPLLPGFYESWIVPAQNRLEDDFVRAVRALVLHHQSRGELDEALKLAQHGVSLCPLREELYGDVIRLRMALGQPAQARRQYLELERVLRDQLGVAPAPDTRELLHCAEQVQVVGQKVLPAPSVEKVPLARPAAESMASTDVASAEVASGTEGSGLAEGHVAAQLPISFTRFIGRKAQCLQLQKMLVRGHARCLTLTGAGGVGKTRLALEVARRLQNHWPETIHFVALADLSNAGRIVETLGEALDVPPSATQLDEVTARLAAAPGLLLLDNFEQLLPWGTPVVQHLLSCAPELRILITSRTRLSLAGEREVCVAPLPTPAADRNPQTLLECESVQLFVDRACAANPKFHLSRHNAESVAQLCTRLDGLPLALELAAARAGVIPPHRMLSRLDRRFIFLDDSPPSVAYRHPSLRAAQEWSYELLMPSLRSCFSQLCVFRGGFTMEAARAVSGESHIAHALEQLRAASLVVAEGERFRLLETLREFAAEQLTPSEYSALQQRHARYFLQVAQRETPHLVACDAEPRLQSYARLKPEHDNFRAALTWSLEEEPNTALALVEATSYSWCDGFSESEALAEAALEKAGDACPELVSAVLGIAAMSAGREGDFARVRELAARRLELVRAMGREVDAAWALFQMGNAALWTGRSAAAREYFGQAIEIFRTHPEQSAAMRQNILWTADRLGVCALRDGDLAMAKHHFQECLRIACADNIRDDQASALCQLGEAACHAGELAHAQELFDEAARIQDEIGDNRAHPWRKYQRGELALLQKNPAQAQELFECALRGFREVDDAVGTLHCLAALGCVLAAQNRFAPAVVLLAAEAAHRKKYGVPLPRDWSAPRRQALSAASAALNETEYKDALARGDALTMPAAAARALKKL